jgi:rhamnulokinase
MAAGSSLYIAVDLGAGSGRVFLGGPETDKFLLQEIRRFESPPRRLAGHLRWDLRAILNEITTGILLASKRAAELERSVSSIGVDSWGVDYGLIDREGNLLEDPVAYRDERTSRAMEQVFALVPAHEIFGRTGIQFLPFNTLFQLHAHRLEGMPPNAAKLLLIPDLVNHHLTGTAVTEYTNATTTQLVASRTGDWDRELGENIGLDPSLLPDILPAGSDLGALRGALADESGLRACRVVAPATHDTGSAVAGCPLESGWAFISSGTWSLVGVERKEVLINPAVAKENFTNEGGAFGTIRFLKNVMGLWLLESCRREWTQLGLTVDYRTLLDEVQQAAAVEALIFPDDPRFLNPPSMLEAIANQLAESGQRMPDRPSGIARIVMDSLALRYASVLRAIERLTGSRIEGVQIVGGGSRNRYLSQATATAANLPVRTGPVEATAAGNLTVQAIADGRFGSLAEARQYLSAKIEFEAFTPQPTEYWVRARLRYAAIEEQFGVGCA